jgi:hypothetical protein
MSIEAMKQALEALEWSNEYLEIMGEKLFPKSKKVQPGSTTWHVHKAITALRQAIEQAEQAQPVASGKLKVTLQDTPTEIELEQYKRMFEAACSALGAIGEALGVDEDEGGAEPILAAIEELKASLPPRQPLTDEEMYLAIRPLFRTDALANAALKISKDEYQAIEAVCGIKG